VLGFQEGVGASHTSLLINTNLHIRIVEYSISQSKYCEFRNSEIKICDKHNNVAFSPHLDLMNHVTR